MTIISYMVPEISTATDRFFLLYLAIFCSFNSLTVQKVKISQNWKKQQEISSFYTSAPKIMIMCYTVLEMWHMTDVIVVFHFGGFFPYYARNSPKKQKFKKTKRAPGDIIILHMCNKKLWLDDVRFLRYGGWQVDGQKKWHIEVGAPPKNFIALKYQVMIYFKNVIRSTLLDIGPKAFSDMG